MADAQKKAREDVRRAQAEFRRKTDSARIQRRERFQHAHDAGLSLRAIGEEAGLHHTRVGEILRGE
jgi:hypothetical protein